MADELQPVPAATDCWASQGKASPGATTNPSTASRKAGGRGELITKIGTVLSAIVASSCCWLPPLLLLMGVSGAGLTSALEAYRPVFIVVTFGFLGAAFYLTYRPRRSAGAAAGAAEDCCAPAAAAGPRRFNMMTMNKVMLWVVTAMAVVFLFFPQTVTGLFAAAEEEITADMQRTVLNVDGMTCKGWEAKAVTALKTAPGVLAVQVDYNSAQATIGTVPGEPVPVDKLLAALESIGYRGEIVPPADE